MANWNVDDRDQQWVVPVGGGIGKLVEIGSQPINAQLSYYYNVKSPAFGAAGSVVFQLQFLFPK